MGWDQVASGNADVWATENTREALFDAINRKEVYGTTGPRMTVRFFGGWDFEAAHANSRLPGDVGYSKGVPMSGDLSRSDSVGSAPQTPPSLMKAPGFFDAATQYTHILRTMASKTISLRVEAYERLRRARTRPGESFSDVVMRAHWDDHTVTGAELLALVRERGALYDAAATGAIDELKTEDRPAEDKWSMP